MTGKVPCRVRVTAKVDYAVRAAMVLARAADADAGPVKGEQIGADQQIPRQVPREHPERAAPERASCAASAAPRAATGWPSSPDAVAIADIIRAVEGPLATVRGERAEQLDYGDEAGALQDMWVAVRASLRSVLEQVTLADVVAADLPPSRAGAGRRPGQLELGAAHQPRSTHSCRWGRSVPMRGLVAVAGQHDGVGIERGEQPPVDRRR